MNRQVVGIFWMLFHCFLISIMAAIIRHAAEDINVFVVIFFYNFFALIFLTPVLITKKRYKQLKTKKLKLHIGRSILGFISLSMYFYAFTVIPLTDARAIALTGPLVSSLLAVIFLKETMGWHRITALIVGFIGALIIVKPVTGSFSYISLMVMASVCMWGVIDMIIKTLSKTDTNISQLFYLIAGMSILSLPTAIYFWEGNLTNSQWMWLIILGAIFLINVLAVVNAFKNGDVTVIMPFDFSGMIFTIIIAYVTFNEIIDISTAFGALIIMMSSVYMMKRESIKKDKENIIAVNQKSEA